MRPARQHRTPRWKQLEYYMNAFGVNQWQAGRMLGMSRNAIIGALWRKGRTKVSKGRTKVRTPRSSPQASAYWDSRLIQKWKKR